MGPVLVSSCSAMVVVLAMLVSVPAVVSAVIWRGIRVGTRCGRTAGRGT